MWCDLPASSSVMITTIDSWESSSDKAHDHIGLESFNLCTVLCKRSNSCHSATYFSGNFYESYTLTPKPTIQLQSLPLPPLTDQQPGQVSALKVSPFLRYDAMTPFPAPDNIYAFEVDFSALARQDPNFAKQYAPSLISKQCPPLTCCSLKSNGQLDFSNPVAVQ